MRNGASFKGRVLPGSIERVRRNFAGVEEGDRQMVDILTDMLTDGLAAVGAGYAEESR